MAILTVGALALIRLTVASAEGAAVSSRFTSATLLASAKLEELLRLPGTDASLTAGTHAEPSGKNLGPTGLPYESDGSPTGAYGADDGWFTRSWVVTDQRVDPTSVSDDYKRIEVSVSWYDGAVKRRRQISVVGGKSLQ